MIYFTKGIKNKMAYIHNYYLCMYNFSNYSVKILNNALNNIYVGRK